MAADALDPVVLIPLLKTSAPTVTVNTANVASNSNPLITNLDTKVPAAVLENKQLQQSEDESLFPPWSDTTIMDIEYDSEEEKQLLLVAMLQKNDALVHEFRLG